MSIGNVLIEKLIQFFSNPSRLKYDKHCQGYVHYSKWRHTLKITPGCEKVLALQKKRTVRIFLKHSEFQSQTDFWKSQ